MTYFLDSSPNDIFIKCCKKKIFIVSSYQPIPTFKSEWMNKEIQQNGKNKEFVSIEQIDEYIFKHRDLFQIIGWMSKDNARKFIRYSPEIFIVACGNKFFLTNRQGGVYNTESYNDNILNHCYYP